MSVAVYVMNGVPEQRMGDVCIMNAASFAKLMEDGDKSFRVLQLDLSPDWGAYAEALVAMQPKLTTSCSRRHSCAAQGRLHEDHDPQCPSHQP